MLKSILEYFGLGTKKTPLEFTYLQIPVLNSTNPLGEGGDRIRIFQDGSNLMEGYDFIIDSKDDASVTVKLLGKFVIGQLDVCRFVKTKGVNLSVNPYPFELL